MTTQIEAGPVSKGKLWAGRILSAIPVLILLFAGGMKLVKAAAVVEGVGKSGFPVHLIIPIGILEVGCTIIYLIPRTSILGAILVTAFLGGATATCVRIGDPGFVMPVLLGMMAWGGLYLRDQRLRELIPLKK
jgi:hypothetical protein